jgi:hypothetical protein
MIVRRLVSGRAPGGAGEKAGLRGPHAATRRRRPIVVPQEVEETMNQQEGQLLVERMAVCFRLARSGVNRDDHIAEEIRSRQWEHSRLWKRQDVGGTIAVQVRPIEPPDSPITDEEHRELITRSAQDG